MNFFEHQNTIAKNLIFFIRVKGYSRLSFSKLTDIPRPMIDKLLMSSVTDQDLYNQIVIRIHESLNLPFNYLLNQTPIMINCHTSSLNSNESYRSSKTRELFDALENVLDIYSMYV